MIKKLYIFVLISFLILDISYSFMQHYSAPIDGDVAGGTVPAKHVRPILENPLGIKVFTSKEAYPNPNRFFSHWIAYQYMQKTPIALQAFVLPLDSAYLASAIIKTIVQVLLIFLLALFISKKVFHKNFIIAAALISPLFQTNGYYNVMAVIDSSVTYVFFYALPIALLLLYFAPLFLHLLYGFTAKSFQYLKYVWIILALIVSLSGPLNPGISLIICGLVFFFFLKNYLRHNKINLFGFKPFLKSIPAVYYFYLLPIALFSAYSLFLGSYNSLNESSGISLLELYSRIPLGLWDLLSQKLGFTLLILIIIGNVIIIKVNYNNSEGHKILQWCKWIGLFSIGYILLLPLGGYREYRPNIVRYDTCIPITLSCIFLAGKSMLFIIQQSRKELKYYYIPLTIIVLLIYTMVDEPKFEKNKFEREAITKIINSKEPIIHLKPDGMIMSWEIIDTPEESKLNMSLLKLWRIVNENKLYYQ